MIRFGTVFLFLAALAGAPAFAQMKRPMPDENGIDVIAGVPIIPSGRLTIGQPSEGGLEFYRVWQGGGWYHNFEGTISRNGAKYTVTVGPSVETFTLASGVFQSDDGLGSTLTVSANGTYTYTLDDGTVLTFENPGSSLTNPGLVGMLKRSSGPTAW